MKLLKEIEEQYAYMWWWLLEQGMFFSAIIVNVFLFSIFTVAMGVLILFLKWASKH